ncbi:MAG: DUF58 domain-containing protein [Planctomycetota bacterium]|jgi:uncharacterized protein (DUF58 family)
MALFDRDEPLAGDDERTTRDDQRARVKLLELRMRRMVSTVLSGAYRSSFRGSGIEFDEVRPYQPGDEVRSIDWNVTARTGAAHIKTYQEERQLVVDLLVDVSASMRFGSRISKLDAAEQFTALISCAAELQRDPVGLNLFADGPTDHLPARSGIEQTQRILIALERARREAPRAGDGAGFATALEELERVLRRRTLLFVVSDFHADSEGWIDPLRRLAQRHDVVAVRVSDALERELPAELGLVPVFDPESGARVELDCGSRRVRSWWAERARERDEAFQRATRRARVETIELSTPAWDPDRRSRTDELLDVEPVIGFFRRRARSKGAPA